MKLRTEIDLKPFERRIDYTDRLFMMGSCFAQNIGERVIRAKFRAVANPTGVLFNPLSIAQTLERLHTQRFVTAAELREAEWGYFHFDFHSSLSGATREATLEQINAAIVSGGEALREADCVVLTLGTAWVYEEAESGRVVANCHKQPQRVFRRRRASVAQIVEALSEALRSSLKDKHIILTISPIRHVADGLEENSLSKATLRLAVEQIVGAHENVHYFPSYEIMMDDLRDYRFYASDMVHPSAVAVDYIWEIFTQTALSAEAQQLMPQVLRVVRAAEHRAQNPTSEAHRRHCKAQLRAIAELPQLDWSEESRYFCGQLEKKL